MRWRSPFGDGFSGWGCRGERKPRLLDLFCGAGGAAMGYSRAGFEVVGVDIKCIIVEGRSDKLKITSLLAEQVLILCTNGTIDEEALLELLEPYEDWSLYIF